MSRTSLITAAAVAGVVLAGAAAVSANIGILSAADDSEIGSLSAAGDLGSVDTRGSAGTQEFAVDEAGTVSVVPMAGGVRLGDVVANTGWTWSPAQADASALAISFTNGSRTLEFTATVGPDGTVNALVEEPKLSEPAPDPSGDDDHGDDDHGDDEHDDDDDGHDDEHEGRDDDD